MTLVSKTHTFYLVGRRNDKRPLETNSYKVKKLEFESQ